jgi:hypothetical protein
MGLFFRLSALPLPIHAVCVQIASRCRRWHAATGSTCAYCSGGAEPGIVPPRFVRAADLQQHDVDRQAISSAIGLPRTARPRGAERPNLGSRRAPAEER